MSSNETGTFLWRSAEPHDASSSLWTDRWYKDEQGDWQTRWDILTVDGSPLGGPAAASFFNTVRGLLSIDHGILVANKTLAYSQRSWEVKFEVDAIDVLGITCADTVRIVSDRIPCVGGAVVGKVKGYVFRISADDAVCEITLAISTGSGEAGDEVNRVVSAYQGDVYRVSYAPPVYAPAFAPPLGIASVEVVNDAIEQGQAIDAAAAAGTDLSQALSNAPTAIRITTLPAGGGQSHMPIMVAVSAYQGYKGIQLR